MVAMFVRVSGVTNKLQTTPPQESLLLSKFIATHVVLANRCHYVTTYSLPPKHVTKVQSVKHISSLTPSSLVDLEHQTGKKIPHSSPQHSSWQSWLLSVPSPRYHPYSPQRQQPYL